MRHPKILSWIWVICAACVVPGSLLGQDSSAFPGGGTAKKKKEKKKEIRFEEVKPTTNLDSAQQEDSKRLDGQFDKLYGYTGEIPETAIGIVRNTVFGTLDGIHRPEREKTDELADELVAVLRERALSPNYAVKLVRGPAELLSADELSKEDFDGLMIEIEQNLAGSRMSSEQHRNIKDVIAAIIMKAKVNEEKVEAREKARKAEEERLEKERQKKLEEAKKRAKRKSRGAGGRSEMP